MEDIEFWQIVASKIAGTAVYRYVQDRYDENIFWYQGYVYEFNEKPLAEIVLKAAIQGNVRFFKLKSLNHAQGVVFRSDMEFVFE